MTTEAPKVKSSFFAYAYLILEIIKLIEAWQNSQKTAVETRLAIANLLAGEYKSDVAASPYLGAADEIMDLYNIDRVKGFVEDLAKLGFMIDAIAEIIKRLADALKLEQQGTV